MHIPDGFLSAPVWIATDVAGLAAVGYFGHRAQREITESKVPLMGVMGAFVFAAQMINFPVGVGVSGHLLGSALLTYTLGPAAAVVVMTAVLALQALVFQDGGLLALGANVLNMAVIGVGAAYLPDALLRRGGARKLGMFLGGLLSVLVGAALALGELIISGIRIPASVMWLSLGLFTLAAVIEGAITLGVVEALGRINPRWLHQPDKPWNRATAALTVAALAIVVFGVLVASGAPDGLEHVAGEIGIADRARALVATPLADYEAAFVESPWLSQVVAGLAGLMLIAVICLFLGRIWSRARRA